MKVENQVHPNPDSFKAFIETEGPVVMVNLLKFKEKAEYEDGRDPELSGREAYMRYAQEMRKLVEGDGGRFIFGGAVVGALLGDIEENWDEVGLVEYTSPASLLKIAQSPAFQEIEKHRVAGLAGQLNITTREHDFGG